MDTSKSGPKQTLLRGNCRPVSVTRIFAPFANRPFSKLEKQLHLAKFCMKLEKTNAILGLFKSYWMALPDTLPDKKINTSYWLAGNTLFVKKSKQFLKIKTIFAPFANRLFSKSPKKRHLTKASLLDGIARLLPDKKIAASDWLDGNHEVA